MSLSLFKPRTPAVSIQWLFAAGIGLMLGVFILFVFRLPSKWVPLLIIAAIFPFLILVIGNLRKCLLALILLDIPFQLDIAIRSHWIFESTGVINGYIISITTICLTALYALWMVEILLEKDSIKLPIRRPNLYLSLYLAITCISLFVADLQLLASFKIFLLLQIFLLYFYVINNIRDRDALLFIVAILLVGLLVESLIIIIMQVSGQGFSFAGVIGNIYAKATAPGDVSRIGGTLVSANSAGSYISLLLVPAFSLTMTSAKNSYKLLALMTFVAGIIALLLTGSRGAWLGASISFLIFGFGSFRSRWLSTKIIMVGIVLAIVIGLLFYAPVYERIFGYDSGAAASRSSQNKIAFQIIRDHPILGVGANNYPVIQRIYLSRDPNNSVFKWAVHNKYLLEWAESGIFGLLFFILFLLSTIRHGFRIAQANDSLYSPLAFGFTAAIIGQMAHMFFDVFHGRPQVQLLWLIAGLLMVMYFLVQEDKRRDSAVRTQG
jgi:O-antigen ligase